MKHILTPFKLMYAFALLIVQAVIGGIVMLWDLISHFKLTWTKQFFTNRFWQYSVTSTQVKIKDSGDIDYLHVERVYNTPIHWALNIRK